MAWKDRTPSSVALKHVTDISLIFDSYFDAMVDVLDLNPGFADLYSLAGEEFEMTWYAAVAIGRKIHHMIVDYPETNKTLLIILATIKDAKEGEYFRNRMKSVLMVKEPVVFGIIERLQSELNR